MPAMWRGVAKARTSTRLASVQTMSDQAAVLWCIVVISCSPSWVHPVRRLRKPAMLWPTLAVSLAWSLASGHSFPNPPLEVLPSAALLTCTVHT